MAVFDETEPRRPRVREERRATREDGGALSTYEQGYRDGYLEGLSECGPIAGVAQFFARRGKKKKLSQMKDVERQALIAEAIAAYEGPARSARERILSTNPKRSKRSKSTKTPTIGRIVAKALK